MIVLRTLIYAVIYFFFMTGVLYSLGSPYFPSPNAIFATLLATIAYPGMERAIVRAIRHG